ncbi:MAG: hypothetical protein QM731_18095 [Chitinophagaceae bacterium]
MIKLRFLLLTLFCFLLVSCYEVNEEIDIKADGSGTYVANMDMGQLLEMLQSFAGEEELSKEGMDRPIDTTILMSSVLDSAKDVTPEQKAVMKDGKLAFKMNVKEKIFKLNTSFPYSGLNNLQVLMTSGKNGAGLTDIFKNIFGGKGEDKSKQLDAPVDPDMGDFSDIFDVTVKDGLISKKLNVDKFKALSSRPEMEQVKQLSGSGMEVMYTTTIHLPRPVKKADNPLIKLSEDKKTVTMKYNMLQLLDTPEKFSYTIEY